MASIGEEIVNAAAQGSLETKNSQDFKNLIKQAQDWLYNYDEQMKKLQNTYQELIRQENFRNSYIKDEKLSSAGVTELIKNAYLNTLESEMQDTIENILKNGYRIIFNIRDLFAEPIQYRILMSMKDVDSNSADSFRAAVEEKNIWEQTISMDTLLDKVVTFDTREIGSKSLKNLDFSNLYTMKVRNEQLRKIINDEDVEEQRLKKPKLYESLMRERDRHGMNAKTYNNGRLYEAYYALVDIINYVGHRAGEPNTIPFSIKALINTQGESVASTHGGDYKNFQLKASWNSGAKLVSSNLIVEVLKDIVNAYNTLDTNKIKSTLKNRFLPVDRLNETINKNIIKEMNTTIDTTIDSIENFDIK